jgi:cytidylate kinase
MQTRDNMTSQEAYEITKLRYDKNRALYKKLYDFDFGNDISVFDKIIDTDDLNATQVIDIAKETVRKLQ